MNRISLVVDTREIIAEKKDESCIDKDERVVLN